MSVRAVGFKISKYKIKSTIEFAKILYNKGDFSRVVEMLNKATIGNEITFKQNPEILNEINQILDQIGTESNLLEGEIVYVNIALEYIRNSLDDSSGLN